MGAIVTAFVPLSDRFVVAGDSESRLSLLDFGYPESGASNVRFHPENPNFRTHHQPLPGPENFWGKCSHSPVLSLISLEQQVAAASGLSVSLWDAVSRARLRHLSTVGPTNCVEFVTSNLVAAAGDECQLSLFDVRSPSQNPSLAQKIALDNLYAMAVDDCSVFCGGADGNIYRIDLRNQVKDTWELPEKDAILDLKIDGARNVVAVTESGAVRCIGQQGHHYIFLKSVGESFSHRIKCDVKPTSHGGAVACGGELGLVSVFHYQKSECSGRTQIPIGDGLVAGVSWRETGVFASNGALVVLSEWEGGALENQSF